MFVSEVTNDVNCKRIEVKSLADVVNLMSTTTICTSTFRGDYRNIENFEKTKYIMLDIDEQCTLSEAYNYFKDYKYGIALSRSHQKDKVMKSGNIKPACDRFRVVLELEDEIDNSDDYYETFASLHEEFPFLDGKCKDPSRQFYASPVVQKVKETGKLVKKRKYIPKPKEGVKVETATKGRLSKTTLEFLAFGVESNFNNNLFNAAKDMQEQGYTKDEAFNLLTNVECKYKKVPKSEYKKTIRSAYKNEGNNKKRLGAFNFKNIKQLFEEKPTINWVVDGLLSEGGISVVAGPPKSGKSTIIRQLSVAIAKGGEFLERKVNPGPVVYLALEEQDALVYDQFKALNVSENDPIMFHVGPLNKRNGFEDFKEFLEINSPRLAVIDTLVLFAQIKDDNNYKEVYNALTDFRDLARATGTHIVCIHHSNKSGGVMGSTAFTGAVDAIFTFENVSGKRFISTQGRGTKDFRRRLVEYNEETQSYLLGDDSDF